MSEFETITVEQLPARLRKQANELEAAFGKFAETALMNAAADALATKDATIAELTSENTRLREALESTLSEAEKWGRLITSKRQVLAYHLAALDGITLSDVRATVGPEVDANNWREYLGRADDLLAMISAEIAS